LAQGAVQLTGKDFQFRGVGYQATDARRLLDQIRNELDEDYGWMAKLDRRVFVIHYNMAQQIGEEAKREMEERYYFHLTVQAIHEQLSAHNQQIQVTLQQLSGKRQLSQAEYYGALHELRTAHDTLRQALAAADQLRLPALKHVTPGECLGPLLLSRHLIHQLSDASNTLDSVWIGRFLEQLGEVLAKTARIHFKSLGGILAVQEKIAEQWSALPRCPAPTGEDG
jgi:hypothetical protein